MAKGTRGRFGRSAYLGLGFVVCSTLVGCMDGDKKPLSGKPPTPGLPNTPMLNNSTSPGRPATGSPTWNVNGQSVPNGSQQPIGGVQPNNYPAANNMQPVGGNQYPAANRNGTAPLGTPTLPGGYPQPNNYNPVVPGVGPTSSLPPNNTNVTAFRGQDPQPLALSYDIQPPARPSTIPAVDNANLAPMAPPMPVSNYGVPALPSGVATK